MALLDSMLDFTKGEVFDLDDATLKVHSSAAGLDNIDGDYAPIGTQSLDLRTHGEPFAGRVGQADNTTGKIDTRRLDVGSPLYLTIKVATEVTGANNCELQFALITGSSIHGDSTDADKGTSSSSVPHLTANPNGLIVGGLEPLVSTGAIPLSQLYKGAIIQLMTPQPFPKAKRFIGVGCRVRTADLTAGKVWAYLTDAPEFTEHYPEAAN